LRISRTEKFTTGTFKQTFFVETGGVIGHIVAADLQPLRFLLLTGMVNGQQGQFKTVLLAQFFQGADRLFAIGRIVIDQRDFLAFKAAAIDVQQMLDRNRCTVPVIRGIVKDVLEH